VSLDCGSHSSVGEPGTAPEPKAVTQRVAMACENDEAQSSGWSMVLGAAWAGNHSMQHLGTASEQGPPSLGSGSGSCQQGASEHAAAAAEVPNPLVAAHVRSVRDFTRMSLEQMMSHHHDVVGQLTAEMVKPGQGRLLDMVRMALDEG
jgi:hypothetical protein